MRVLDLIDENVAIDVIAYPVDPDTVAISINRNGACVLRVRIPINQAPVSVDIDRPTPKKEFSP